MNQIKIGFIVLNIQLLVAVITGYTFFTRFGLIHNVEIFFILTICLANLLFYLLKKIKYFSLRSFICIMVSAVVMMLLVNKYNKPQSSYGLDEYIIASAYTFSIFRLYITTPLSIIFEVVLNLKMKQKKRLN